MIYFQAHIPCNQYLLLLKADSRCFSNKNLGLKNLLFVILSLSFIVDNMMLLEVYMVVNFRTRRINRGAHKLTRTPMLIIKQRLTITLQNEQLNFATSLQYCANSQWFNLYIYIYCLRKNGVQEHQQNICLRCPFNYNLGNLTTLDHADNITQPGT